jgi:DNA helicase-2/ATP-dependent DNA helicase PcrA
MRIIADLHVHSRFSRACSKDLTLENNALWCEKKGVNVLGTGDFTHPLWFKDIEEKLVEAEPGLYKLKSGEHPKMRYLMTSEVSQIYKRGGKARRVHNLIFAPNIEAVKKINTWLDEKKFNRKSDGRPILGIDSEVLYRELKNLDDKIVLAPAHAWTPWFAVFGSKSGFDTLEDCFGEMTKEVFAIETGLSSDPIMNRALSVLDRLSLISNSDAHSPQNFGREANVFEIDESKLSFDELMRVLRERDLVHFLYTIEFYPEEGKYHVDGHAPCGLTFEPKETKRLGGICPKCGKLITVGVTSRVADLADRPIDRSAMTGHVPFKSIVPLPEVLAECLNVSSPSSKKVIALYEDMIQKLGSEFSILLDIPVSEIRSQFGETVAEAITRVRSGNLTIKPGYDGIFGVVKIFSDDEKKEKQKKLF